MSTPAYVTLSVERRNASGTSYMRTITRRFSRYVGAWACAAFVAPDVGREVEVWADPSGRFSVDSRPDAVHGGERRPIVRGELTPDGHRLTSVDLPGLSAEDLRAVSVIARRHLPLPISECDRISDALSALAEITS